MRKIKSLAGLMIMSMAMVLGMASMNAEAAKKKGAGTITNNVKVVMDYEDNETNPVPIEGTKVSIKGGLLGTKFLLGDKYYECDENGRVSFKQTSRITNMYFELPEEWKDKVTVDKVLYHAKLAGTFKYKNYSVESKDISNNGFRIGMPLAWTKVDTTIHFKPKKYNVTFVYDDDKKESVEVAYLKTVTAPTTEKEGYTFKGWYTEGAEKAFDFETKIKGDITLTAKWEINKYTVTFKDGESTTTETVKYGDTVKEPVAPTKEGHTFKGWYAEGAETGFDFKNTAITDNITLTAKWEINKYTVTFKDGESTTTETVKYGDTVKEPVAPTKEGYSFEGWYTESGDKFEKSNPITSDIALTAHWKINTYIVRFMNENEEVKILEKVEYNTKIDANEDPTPQKEGYILKGWYNGDEQFKLDEDVVKSNLTLTAKWERNPGYDSGKVSFFIYHAPDVKWNSVLLWNRKKVMSHDEQYFISLGEEGAYLSKVSVFDSQWKRDFASYDVIENPAIPGNDVAFYNSSNQPIADVTGLLTDQIKNQMNEKYQNHPNAVVKIYRLTKCDDSIHVDLALYDETAKEWVHNMDK